MTVYYESDGLPLTEALDRGLAWLFTTEHPPGAMVFHLGDSLRVRDNRRLSFIPAGSRSGRAPVVVLEVAAPRKRRAAKFNDLQHVPLTPVEMDQLAALLEQRRHQIIDQWNGFPATGGSLALGTALHPSMLAALDRYRAGCPAHGGTVFCHCPLWTSGYERLVPLRTRSQAVVL